jgi:hypothetical protein
MTIDTILQKETKVKEKATKARETFVKFMETGRRLEWLGTSHR